MQRSSSKHTAVKRLQLQVIMHVHFVVHVLLFTKPVHAALFCMGDVKIGNSNNMANMKRQHNCNTHAYLQKDA